MTAAVPFEVITWGPLRFVRKPIELAPAEGFLCFVEDMSTGRRIGHGAGKLVGGEWQDARGKPLNWRPTHWTAVAGADD